MIVLVLKERLRSIYGKYAVIVNGMIKFVYTFLAVWLLNDNLGFMTKLASPVMMAGMALVGAFVPYSVIALMLGLVMLGHIYTVSMELALLVALFLMIVMLLYYGFQPGDSFWLVLTPLAFYCKIPLATALLVGLSGSLVTAIPVSCGIVIYYILSYVKQNAGVLTNDASIDIAQKFVLLINTLLTNREMLIMIVAVAIGILIVYTVHNLSIDYAWVEAMVFGVIGQLVVIFIGDSMFDVELPFLQLIMGAVIAVAIAALYYFFVFMVDYTRTEYTQFEDDEYVYYVKAVPKVAVSKPDVQVQRINHPKKKRRTAE